MKIPQNPYKASQVANFFLERAEREGKPLTMLKLVKICYIAHGWVLGLTGRPLVEEDVEAWQYGPVIPSLYHEFKKFGRQQITGRASEFSLDSFDFETPEIPTSDQDTRMILEKVWSVYRNITGGRLVDKTHADGTPWKKAYQVGKRNVLIDNDKIREHYHELLTSIAN